MRNRVHKALSMMPEDLERLQKLSAKAGMTESQYIRTLLKCQEALLEGKEDELRIMSDRENKESPSGDDEGGQGSEAHFLTKNLPRTYIYWEAYNYKLKEYFLYQINTDDGQIAGRIIDENTWDVGPYSRFHYFTREQAAKWAYQHHKEELAAREELKRMGIQL